MSSEKINPALFAVHPAQFAAPAYDAASRTAYFTAATADGRGFALAVRAIADGMINVSAGYGEAAAPAEHAAVCSAGLESAEGGYIFRAGSLEMFIGTEGGYSCTFSAEGKTLLRAEKEYSAFVNIEDCRTVQRFDLEEGVRAFDGERFGAFAAGSESELMLTSGGCALFAEGEGRLSAGTDNYYALACSGKTLSYTVIYGGTAGGALMRYARLHARPELPPAWAFEGTDGRNIITVNPTDELCSDAFYAQIKDISADGVAIDTAAVTAACSDSLAARRRIRKYRAALLRAAEKKFGVGESAVFGGDPFTLGCDSTAASALALTGELRGELMAYIFGAASAARETGMPVVRPVFAEFDSAEIYDPTRCFMLGSDLLVFAPASAGESIVLPAACGWTNIADGCEYAAGAEYTAPTEAAVIFAREGSLVPFGPCISEIAGEGEDAAFTTDGAEGITLRAFGLADGGEVCCEPVNTYAVKQALVSVTRSGNTVTATSTKPIAGMKVEVCGVTLDLAGVLKASAEL